MARMEQHIKIVALLHIILGGIFVAIAIAMFVFGAGAAILSAPGSDEAIAGTTCFGIIAVLIALLSLPSIIAGIGLQRRRKWARILTIVLSVINLFNFPFGTALGGYSLWVLLNDQSTSYFV
jgi:hypothetical protein